jgi:beta-glucosidase
VTYLCTAGAGYNGPAGLGSPAGAMSLSAAGGAGGHVFSGMQGLCLDNEYANATAGNTVQIFGCNAGTAQDWTAEPDGTFRWNGTSYCLNVSSATNSEGYHLVDLAACDASSQAMQWIPRADDSLYNPGTGWCLADPGASTTSVQVIDGTCNGSASQHWYLPYTRPAVSGSVVSKITAGPKCMDDANSSTANGNKIQIWDCIGDAAQTGWTIAADGTLQIYGKCIAAQNNGTANGTLIVLWSCEGNPNSVWTERSDGSFINTRSGTCLTDPSNSTTNGTQLVLWTCNGSAAEGWTIP